MLLHWWLYMYCTVHRFLFDCTASHLLIRKALEFDLPKAARPNQCSLFLASMWLLTWSRQASPVLCTSKLNLCPATRSRTPHLT